MHISGYVHLNPILKESTTATRALIANRLSHDMILSWQDCIQLKIVPETFPLPSNLGQVNEIHNKVETIKETLTNKFEIIRDDISLSKILTDPIYTKLWDTKITPYRASTTRQIPLRYQAQSKN